MKPLPLPLRVAAGLAVTAAEHARGLPKQVVGLPVTVLSQVLQFSMRLQQQVTELAIKGDEALSSLRPVDETPSWATFDEDLPTAANDTPVRNGFRPVPQFQETDEAAPDPWEQEERALAEDHTEGEFDSAADEGDFTAGPDNLRTGRSGAKDTGGAAAETRGTAGDEFSEAGTDASAAETGAQGLAGGGGAVRGLDGGISEEPDATAGASDTTRLARAEGPGAEGPGAEGSEQAEAGAAGLTGREASEGEGDTAPQTGTAGLPEPPAAGPSETEGSEGAEVGGSGPIGIANYDELTLPQLRARLRRFSLGELEELLTYERAHENRPSFVGMLTRRIGNVQRLAGGGAGVGGQFGE